MVSEWISYTIGKGYGFQSGFPPFSFTVYINFTVKIRKRLREFEELHKRLREFENYESLKGLSYEIDFENVDENLQILALRRAAAGF